MVDTKHLRGLVEMVAGSTPVARGLLLDAVETVETRDGVRAASMLADASATLLQEANPPAALETVLRAEASFEGRAAADLKCSVIRATAESLCGNTKKGLELGAQVKLLLDRADALLNPWLVPGFAFNWQCLGRGREALEIVNRLLERARVEGALMIVPYALVSKCDCEFVLGNWSAAYAAGTESVRLAEETGQRGEMGHSLAYLARVEAGRGEADECRAHARAAIASSQESGATSISHIAGAALGHLELGLDRTEAAAQQLQRVEDDLKGLRQPTVLRSAGDLVEAYFRAGHATEAERALENLEEEAGLTGGRWAHAVAARCRGLLAGGSEFESQFEHALRLQCRGLLSVLARADGALLRRAITPYAPSLRCPRASKGSTRDLSRPRCAPLGREGQARARGHRPAHRAAHEVGHRAPHAARAPSGARGGGGGDQ